MIEILVAFVLVALSGCSVALWTWFLDFCFGGVGTSPEPKKGRIFSRIGLWMFRGYNSREKEIASAEIRAAEEAAEEIEKSNLARIEKLSDREKKILRDRILGRVNRMNWWKALGVCPVCSNVWWCFVFYPVVATFLGLSLAESFFFFIPFVVISNGLLRRIIVA